MRAVSMSGPATMMGATAGCIRSQQKSSLLRRKRDGQRQRQSDSQQPAVYSAVEGVRRAAAARMSMQRVGLGVEGLLGGRFGARCDGFRTAQGTQHDWPEGGQARIEISKCQPVAPRKESGQQHARLIMAPRMAPLQQHKGHPQRQRLSLTVGLRSAWSTID